MTEYPTRDDIIKSVANVFFSGSILNNSHRGDVVEMMVLAALGSEWKSVGREWHPWDLQRGTGPDRIRIQINQWAALQRWGPTVKPVLSLNWSDKPPAYFESDHPGETIESEGWFCDVFVFGVHQESDPNKVDQVDPRQWKFLVIPTCDLKTGARWIDLTKAMRDWPLCAWHELPQAVDQAIFRLTNSE